MLDKSGWAVRRSLLKVPGGEDISLLAIFGKDYASGKGAKWILTDRLNKIKKLKIVKQNKKVTLTQLGFFLSITLIFFRKILSIKDFG